MLSETCLLTAGKRKIKGSLCGSIRPKTDATAGRVDTHSAGMRSHVALRKVQSPEIGKAELKIYLNSTTMYRYICLHSFVNSWASNSAHKSKIYLKGPTYSSVGRWTEAWSPWRGPRTFSCVSSPSVSPSIYGHLDKGTAKLNKINRTNFLKTTKTKTSLQLIYLYLDVFHWSFHLLLCCTDVAT